MTLTNDCEARAAVIVADSAEIGTGPRSALVLGLADLDFAECELATVVKPKRPDEATCLVAPFDLLGAGLAIAWPTVGAAVGGDRIGVPGPTIGTCHAVPLGNTVIGMAKVLLVP